MGDIDEPIHIVDYRPEWAAQASEEAARIAKAMGLAVADVEHVGSTAVVGLASRPIVDLMVGIPYYRPWMLSKLAELGYHDFGESPGVYFRLRGSASFNVHLVIKGFDAWRENIALRAYLQSNPAAQLRYTQAKQAELSWGNGKPTLYGYSIGKSAIMAQLMKEASPKKKFVGVCYVGRHQTRGNYIILRFGHDPARGFEVMYGPVIRVPATEMEQNGLGIVLSHIQNPPSLNSKAPCDPSLDIPLRERQKLKREHPLVDISLLEGTISEVKIKPLHAGRGGRFDVRVEEITRLPLPATNEDFMKLLAEALETAT